MFLRSVINTKLFKTFLVVTVLLLASTFRNSYSNQEEYSKITLFEPYNTDHTLNQDPPGQPKALFYDDEFIHYRFSTLLQSSYMENPDNTTCAAVESSFLITRSSLEFTTQDLKVFRDILVHSRYKNLVQDAADSQLLEHEILGKKWLQFGGNSVYLPEYKIHIMVSRVLYIPLGEKDKPKASFIGLKAYDQSYKEIKGTLHFKYLKEALGSTDTPILEEHSTSITFPNILNIKFNHKLDFLFLGPEDPKISLDKKGNPVVTFNMYDTGIKSRRLYALKVFENTHVQLRIKNKLLLGVEKNWVPFTYTSSSANLLEGNTKTTTDFSTIRLVYSFDPLHIIECNLENGICDIVNLSEDEFLKAKHESFIKRPNNPQKNKNKKQLNKLKRRLGGGTTFHKVPDSLKLSLPSNYHDYTFWISFSRTHIKKCGCGKVFYRPNIVIMSEFNNNYKIHSILSSLGFNFVVKSYRDNSFNSCLGKKSVLLVNGINQWQYVDSDNDILTLSITQADYGTELIQIKGFKNYIISTLQNDLTEGNNEGSNNQASEEVNTKLIKCALEQAFVYCKDYSDIHPLL